MNTFGGAVVAVAVTTFVLTYVALELAQRFRCYRVTYGPFYARYFWTLTGARRWRDSCSPRSATRLYWWIDGRWVEFS